MQETSEKTITGQEPCEALRFTSGGFSLSGFLHLPDIKNPPIVIGSHGLLSDADSSKQRDLASSLLACGVGFFRFHHRGSGNSEGHLAESSLDTRVEDMVAAWEMLSLRKDLGRPFGLFGSSMGGATCISAWSTIRPAATFLIAPLIKGRVLTQQEPADMAAILQESGLPETFFTKNLHFDLTERIPAMRNLFVVHGTDDKVVPVEEGHRVYELAAEPKRFIAFEGGDHRISHPGHQKIMLKRAVDFFEEKLTLKARTCGM
ncbi:alpha/beta hydrolase [Desulfobotulus sp. H1]|uniref:Alpha/beta hydrolase n=1 Tax=Desulfobotulus pelophilus TaxID=2823377 RepID=A0ABT3N9G5_9BACT|nr:alpha/beta hydrolase [Desulfobotulus pelophilus]MCW7754107.1 alpha/beta hydrolase [Desulfobotulus pelophilus]